MPIEEEQHEVNKVISSTVSPPASFKRTTKNSMKTSIQCENFKECKIQKLKKADKIQLVTTSTEQTYQNSNSLKIVYNQHLSARLIKSMQPIPKIPYVTKGGASANKIDSPTQSSSNSSEINIDSNTIVEPPIIAKNKLTENELAATNQSLFIFQNKNQIASKLLIKKDQANLIKYDTDDKDLVSKRLKEKIHCNESNILKISNNKYKINTMRRTLPSSEFEFKQQLCKKRKRDSVLKALTDTENSKERINLNDSLNSIIIIDSDNEEDEDELVLVETAKHRQNSFDLAINDTQYSRLKNLNVRIENLDIEQIIAKNHGLKISKSTLNILNENNSKKSSYEQIQLNKAVKKTIKNMNVKFKCKIFPNTSKLVKTEVNLDEITVLSTLSNHSSYLSDLKGMSNDSGKSLRKRLKHIKHDSATPLSSANFCTLPTSPAELLRKSSVRNDSACEMDKLFKGESMTVTQCLECENLRKSYEAFYDRSIPIDKNDDTYDDEDEAFSAASWILKCLKNESYLNENSKYMCDKCSSKQEAKIYTQYTQMPNILILHLLSYGITSRLVYFI